jgi:hypothetical protein
MKKDVALSVPKPCHEKWDSFIPTARGGFCSSCQKEVIDFTSWTDDRIMRYFQTGAKTCGRFRPAQLKSYHNDTRRPRSQILLSVFALSVLSLFWSRPSVAQSREKQRAVTEQLIPEPQHREVTLGETTSALPVVVSGQITVADDGSVQPGVNVVRKGTTQVTVTDVEGKFQMTLTNPQPDEILVVSFIGFITQEIKISGIAARNIGITMENDVTRLGGIEVTYLQRPAISPRRIWNKIKEILAPAGSTTGEASAPACDTRVSNRSPSILRSCVRQIQLPTN